MPFVITNRDIEVLLPVASFAVASFAVVACHEALTSPPSFLRMLIDDALTGEWEVVRGVALSFSRERCPDVRVNFAHRSCGTGFGTTRIVEVGIHFNKRVIPVRPDEIAQGKVHAWRPRTSC